MCHMTEQLTSVKHFVLYNKLSTTQKPNKTPDEENELSEKMIIKKELNENT